MARWKSIGKELEKINQNEGKPIYILDTSGVIDYQKADSKEFMEFLEKRFSDTIITLAMLDEMRLNHRRYRGSKKLISTNAINELERISRDQPVQRITSIKSHPLYDTHRLEGYWAAKSLKGKKADKDSISAADLEALAIGLTIAANSEDFGLEDHYPLIISGDAHLTTTGPLLAEGRPIPRKDTEPYEIEHDYSRLKTIRTRK